MPYIAPWGVLATGGGGGKVTLAVRGDMAPTDEVRSTSSEVKRNRSAAESPDALAWSTSSL